MPIWFVNGALFSTAMVIFGVNRLLNQCQHTHHAARIFEAWHTVC
jgi:hypothetical protein